MFEIVAERICEMMVILLILWRRFVWLRKRQGLPVPFPVLAAAALPGIPPARRARRTTV